MFKTIDLRPVRALEKSELIERVYSLSEENEKLKDKIEYLKNLPPKIKIIRENPKPETKSINIVYSENIDFRDTNFACQLYNVDPYSIFAKGNLARKMERVQARAVICYIFRMKGYSLTRIGREIKRDHATVINALDRYAYLVDDQKQEAVNDYLQTMYNINQN
jgi:chromosomal replication initiation ATPase DnaA